MNGLPDSAGDLLPDEEPAVGASQPPAAELVEAWLLARLSEVLGIEPHEIDINEPFASYGLGSVQAVSLMGDLEGWLGRRLDPTLAYEYPTVEALTRYLTEGRRVADSAPLALHTDARAEREPIAIIGIGCRFPGARNPEAFWRLLRDGVNAVTEVPSERWDTDALFDPDPSTPGKLNSRWGGFIEHVDKFDCRFFGISPREAARIDPQQRLLLEVGWEALEDAGQIPEQLKGTRTGVFIGVSTNDYGRVQCNAPELLDAYAATGNASSIAANRLSYMFDFRGPSIAVDTACSSSLVALHLACSSVWNGESTLALVGGVNLLLSPLITISFTKAGLMSPGGACKAFAEGADGYVRGEGAGVVVLKPLSRALAEGDSIYAVIRGSAVNQDGRTNGLMAPNREAQEALLLEAYRHAGISPGRVQYVEAHALGTTLGDQIEAKALGAALGRDRPPGSLCAIGSVKTNVGHLEAAAGVAGLIKVALSLKHRAIPPSLHFRRPNPSIPFEQLPLRVQQTLTTWPSASGPALAGVSAFGFGGTNAHVVLQEAPRADEVDERGMDAASRTGAQLLPISARGPEALRSLALAYRDFLRAGEPAAAGWLGDVCYTASVRRSHHNWRLALRADSGEELCQQLEAFLRGETCPGLSSGRKIPGRRRKLVFVFPDRVSQLVGPGRRLLEQEPVFRAALERCEQALRPHTDWSLREMLRGVETSPRVNGIEVVRPTLFALQVGLAALWRHWGVEPDAVVGYGVGEVAAAHVSGALTLEDAVRVLCCRSRSSKRTNGHPESSRDDLAEALKGLQPRPSSSLFYSTVTGQVCDGLKLDAAYWLENLRRPVLFSQAVQRLLETGHEIFLELSPHPTLLPAVQEGFEHAGKEGILLPSLRREEEESAALLNSLGALYASGQDVSWDKLQSTSRCCTRLPTYPWQRERCWLDLEESGTGSSRSRDLPGRHGSSTPEVPDGSPPHPDTRDIKAENLDDCLYELQWQPTARLVGELGFTPPLPGGRWLIFADSAGVAEALTGLLAAKGETCVLVSPGEAYKRVDEEHFQIEPRRPEDLRHVLRETLGSGQSSWRGIIHLWSLEVPSVEDGTAAMLEEAQVLGCGSVLRLVQELAQAKWQHPPQMWLVTQGAQPVAARPARLALAQTPLWGLGRTMALEHFDLWRALVDLDPEATAREAATFLCEQMWGSDREDQLACRRGERYVARLVRKRLSAEPSSPASWRIDASYLITGGLGDMGLRVARRMVEQGARRVILLGRTQLPPRSLWKQVAPGSRLSSQINAILELEALGASVHPASVDVADESQLTTFLEAFRGEGWPPIRGVIHAAGVVELQTLVELDAATMRAVMRPKVIGGWLLHRLLRDDPLDFFVLFSSTTSLLSSPRLGHDAAANAFLDALAHHRRAENLPAISINWAPWDEVGLAAGHLPAGHSLLGGVESFSPERGLDVLCRLLQQDATQVGVMRIDWAQRLQPYGELSRPPLLSILAREQTDDLLKARKTRTKDPLTREALLAVEPEQRQRLLEAHLGPEVARVLGLSASELDLEAPFNTLGIDSLMAVELKNRLAAEMGIVIPLVQFLEGSSVSQIITLTLNQLKVVDPNSSESEALEATTDRIPAEAEEQRPLELDQLSDAEVDSMLRELLASKENHE